jgi:hypothetical protein
MTDQEPFDIDPRARSYYDRMTLEDAVQIAREKVDEWDYDADPHGYCHERPMLIALILGVEILIGRR